MLAKRNLRWSALWFLLPVAAVFGAWGMSQAIQYRTGEHQTLRGEIIQLPNGRFWATHAYYSASGARVLVFCAGGIPNAGTQDKSGGYWMLDPAAGTARLIHDNFDGSLWWGSSLCRVEAARPSPDGSYVGAFRKCYSEAARSIRADDPQRLEAQESALDSYQWELIEVATGSRTQLLDFTDECRSRDFVRKPRGYVWLDNERLAFVRTSPEAEGTRIYTLDIASGRIEAVITEAPGSCVRNLRRVSAGKLLYHVQTRDALDQAAQYRKATVFTGRDPAVAHGLDEAGSSLKLADLRGGQPVVRTLEFANPDVDVRCGYLSADERYYAFRTASAGGAKYCLAIISLQTGRLARLDDEISRLCGWHPDDSRLLAVLSAEDPTDPPGVLVEIPVSDVCRSLD